ncbi:glycosyltransferase family 2 protein [Yoonia sp. F2084L]|uniref:glycosyltransferase family 2 protein n=1 Tax=Yoonia sp. F2084L TaxID=2926419 RepID=UPI001FF26AB2|nr:glycosyltransferase family 2 protein [Yoonia sp. F2084L]MCK0097526.1 glycosyltransferase family 2 protein [Yoonia sp. F2084L]
MAVSERPWRKGLWHAYRLRWKRRRFLFRIWRKRHQIAPRVDRTDQITSDAILAFATVRNEIVRLPHFLSHYRKLGVDHFLFVDNGSDDGTAEYLAAQSDVSLWHTTHSYRLARFGMDWLGWLQWQHGHKHWCLTVDADELLIYPTHEARDLKALTGWLDDQGHASFGAMLLDLYPKGPLGDVAYDPGDDPTKTLAWFDAGNYRDQLHDYYGNLWIQGGVRERVFFADEPARAPTLNKTPLVRWSRRYAYVSSTHQILPTRLHDVFDFAGDSRVSGVLLHTKFLPIVAAKSAEELQRGQHFQNTALYTDYHKQLTQNPDLWHKGSQRYEGDAQLVALGLMSKGRWV